MKVLPDDLNSFLAPAKKETQIFEPREAFEIASISEVGYTAGKNPAQPCPTCPILIEGKDNPDCHAKRVAYNGENGVVEKYFVKVGLGGFMFDPWSSFSEGSSNKYARTHGKPVWNYVEVNKKAFEFYKTFLQTRNKAWKNNAEREVR